MVVVGPPVWVLYCPVGGPPRPSPGPSASYPSAGGRLNLLGSTEGATFPLPRPCCGRPQEGPPQGNRQGNIITNFKPILIFFTINFSFIKFGIMGWV